MEKDNLNKKSDCKSCKTDKGVIRTQRFLVIFGAIMFALSIYGLVSLINDLKTFF